MMCAAVVVAPESASFFYTPGDDVHSTEFPSWTPFSWNYVLPTPIARIRMRPLPLMTQIKAPPHVQRQVDYLGVRAHALIQQITQGQLSQLIHYKLDALMRDANLIRRLRYDEVIRLLKNIDAIPALLEARLRDRQQRWEAAQDRMVARSERSQNLLRELAVITQSVDSPEERAARPQEAVKILESAIANLLELRTRVEKFDFTSLDRIDEQLEAMRDKKANLLKMFGLVCAEAAARHLLDSFERLERLVDSDLSREVLTREDIEDSKSSLDIVKVELLRFDHTRISPETDAEIKEAWYCVQALLEKVNRARQRLHERERPDASMAQLT